MSNIGVVLKKELNNLKERIVRIQKMELNNLKNVGKGTIKFACNMRENIFEDKLSGKDFDRPAYIWTEWFRKNNCNLCDTAL